ncbi:MAG: thioredoxin family protein [Candidatus Aenigmatarchaeota archaeon]
MIVKIFWQPECPKCPRAKEIGEALMKEGHKVEFFNIKEVDGLAESLFYDVLSTPSIIILENGEKKAAWYGDVPEINEIKEFL